eukprot:TRINITY_DN4804_c0_g1_i4.p1 TRINITY_DN4804_c0_g1~~TRINITY_DN4804_c0_g1_i4.p1  ORF type:complete len:144 (+),score=55.16 TRINITY_DN4804_c0_g1_i4:546-977(+)
MHTGPFKNYLCVVDGTELRVDRPCVLRKAFKIKTNAPPQTQQPPAQPQAQPPATQQTPTIEQSTEEREGEGSVCEKDSVIEEEDDDDFNSNDDNWYDMTEEELACCEGDEQLVIECSEDEEEEEEEESDVECECKECNPRTLR